MSEIREYVLLKNRDKYKKRGEYMKTKNFARATHGKVTRYYSDVVKLEDILFPYIHNKVEKIANEKYSKFNYN